jgi:hypothetical protein
VSRNRLPDSDSVLYLALALCAGAFSDRPEKEP